MCRLYAMIANEPTRLDCSLVNAQKGILSDRDADKHPDGWGIAYYHDEVPTLLLDARTKFHDPYFHEEGRRIFARTFVSDIRRSQIGTNCPLNTQPFSYDQWAFAHAGTIAGFDRLEVEMEQRLERRLLDAKLGTTDSELFFLWVATYLKEAGVFEVRTPDFSVAQLAIIDAVTELNELCVRVTETSPNLSFVLTNGNALFGCRWNGNLHFTIRLDAQRCEICGESHVRHSPKVDYRAVAISSQTLTKETWNEVPNHGLVAVTPNLTAEVTSMKLNKSPEVKK